MLQDLLQRNRNYEIQKEKYIHDVFDSVIKRIINHLRLAADYGYNNSKITLLNALNLLSMQLYNSQTELYLTVKEFLKNDKFERYIKLDELKEYVESFFINEGISVKACESQNCNCRINNTLKQSLLACWAFLWKEDKSDQPAVRPSYKTVICSICLAEIIKVAYDPCGHVNCEKCAEKMSKCQICENNIDKKLKLFY